MSEHTSLPLLTEGRYKLNVPFQREKKSFPTEVCTCKCSPKPFQPPPTHSTAETKLEELVILSIIPMPLTQPVTGVIEGDIPSL